jgi:rare lipoprotein A
LTINPKIVLAFFLIALAAATSVHAETGIASFYTDHRVACPGEHYDARAMNAAHRTLPCHSLMRVTNTRTGKSIVVRINDRGPYIRGRIIDLTPAGARALGMDGLARVTVERVE